MFDQIIGQKNTTSRLQRDIVQDQLAHAYLFVGIEGIGKACMMKTFAQEIHAASKTKYPMLDTCIIDQVPFKGNTKSPGDTTVSLEPRQNDSVLIEDIHHARTFLSQSSFDTYKILIVTDIHRLNRNAANSLLKLIEEPPASEIVMLFSTSQEDRVLPTLHSRLEHVMMSPWDGASFQTWLQQSPYEAIPLEHQSFLPMSPSVVVQYAEDEVFRNNLANLINLLAEPHRSAWLTYGYSISDRQLARFIVQCFAYKLACITPQSDQLAMAYASLSDAKQWLQANVSVKHTMSHVCQALYPLFHL